VSSTAARPEIDGLTEDISLDSITDTVIFYRLNLDEVPLVLHRSCTELAPGTHLGGLDIPELFASAWRMEGDLARHEVHNGGTSLFTVDTDSPVFSSIGVSLTGEDDRRDVEVLP